MRTSGNRRRLISLALGAALIGATFSAAVDVAAADRADAATRNIAFTVDGNDLDTNPADAWKGFGAVTANNTSRLLLDYKDEHPAQYWKIMNDLFNPITGMGLTQVKIELGSDGNTSSGTEPATKRTADDVANTLRGAGFHFAADAKSINPGVEVSLLRWAQPAWVKTNEDLYQWYKQTIDAAYDQYGLVVDWVDPNDNETPANVSFITYFGQRLQQDTAAGLTRYDYSKIKLATSDELDTANMGNDMLTLVNPSSLTQEQMDAARTPDPNPVTAKAQAVDPANAGVLWTVTYPQYGNTTYYYRVANQTYMSLISALTHHYTINTSPAMAILNRTYGMEIWYSEGVAGIGQGEAIENGGLQDGGQTVLDVADLFIDSYNNSGSTSTSNGYPTTVPDAHHTLYMYQPAVSAFPMGTTYTTKTAIEAYTPWSGDYDRDLTYFMTKQFTNFARTGTKTGANQAGQVGEVNDSGAWEYVEGGASAGSGTESNHSINGAGASHLTLSAPDRSDFSVVLNNHSDDTVNYTITVQNMSVVEKQRLAVYRTQVESGAAFDSNWFQRLDDIDISSKNPDGSFTFTFTVAPQSINTLTTLDNSQLPAPHVVGDGVYSPTEQAPLDESTATSDVIYSDDFEYANYPPAQTAWDYSTFQPGNTDPTTNATQPTGPELSYLERRGNTPRYSNDMNGAFEVGTDGTTGTGGTENHALTQQLTYSQIPGCWTCSGPETLIGDDHWANYTVSTDVQFDTTTAPSPSFPNYVGVGGRANQEGNGYLFLLRADGAWGITQDAGAADTVVPSMTSSNTLAHGTISGFVEAGTHHVAVTMRGTTVVASVDGHAVATWTDPDGLNTRLAGRVNIVSGWYRNSFDNLTVTRVAGYPATISEYVDDGDGRVQYSGSVTHYAAGSQAQFRSGTTLNSGGGFQLSFTGSGFFLETDTATGQIAVTVDGTQVTAGTTATASRTRNDAYALTGLAYGPHTIAVTSTTGGFKLDSVGIYGQVAPGGGTAALQALIQQYAAENLNADDYSQASWAAYQDALAAAQAIVASPPATQGPIDDAQDALELSHDGLVLATTPITVLTPMPQLTAMVGQAPDYSTVTAITSVQVQLVNGTTAQAAVTWPDPLPGASAYTHPFGTVTIKGAIEGTTSLFAQVTVTVVPTSLVYVIDSGRAGLDSQVFDAAKAAEPTIVNTVPDQAYAPGLDWGFTSNDPTATVTGDASNYASSYLGDSNDPDGLIYNLTLDPGSYELTAVHSTLRALNAESWVTVDGQKVDDKTYAVSTSSETVVTHDFTLTQRETVSFQATRVGSSGFNVRLTLLYVRKIPEPLGVVGAIQEDPTALPATILDDGTPTAVTWDDSVTTSEFTQPWTSVPVSGIRPATGLPFAGSLLVIPPDLDYFFDSGAPVGNEPAFDAVETAVPGLLNTLGDQVSDGTTWGHAAAGANVKGSTNPQDIFDTGLWADDGSDLVYYAPLPAGTYTFTAGVKEWFGQNRTMTGVVTDGTTTADTPPLSISPSHLTDVESTQITLLKPAMVTFSITGGLPAPVVSWVAVTGAPSRPAVVSGSSVTLTNQFSVTGDQPDMHVNGDLSCNSQVHIAGSVHATGNAYLTNGCTVGGDLWVGGNVTMDSTPTVGGDVTAGGSVRFQSTGHIGGNVTAGTTFTVTDGKTIAQLQQSGHLGGQVLTGVPVPAPVVDAWVGEASVGASGAPGSDAITWQHWFNTIAETNNAPPWSAGLTDNPGCVIAPWSSSVNGDTITVAADTVVDARSVTSGCTTVSLQQMTVDLDGDLTIYASGFSSINGLHVVSADGNRHSLHILVPGDSVDCGSGGVNLSANTVIDPLVTTEIRTPGGVTLQTGSQISGQIVAGCLSQSGSETVTALGPPPPAVTPVTITPGTVWTDTAGDPIQAHGEGIIKVGSTYYWLGEDKTNGSPFQNINCYSSTDLKNWTFVNHVLTQQPSGDLGPNRIVERPHVIYNAATKQYVMWMHIDNTSYTERKAGVATSSSVCGDYTYLGSTKPLGNDSLDDNLFLDGGTAYFMSEDRTDAKLQIYELTPDFLHVSTLVTTLPQYEAPAMVKVDGTYYLFGSHLTGWDTNDNQYATATSIAGPWSTFMSFAPSGSNTCDSQTTAILPVTGSATTSYLFLGDRWNPDDLADSRYVWEPLTVNGPTVSMACGTSWRLNPLAGSAPPSGGLDTSVGTSILRGLASGRCLDVPGQTHNDGTQIEIWDCNGGSNQSWSYTPTGEIQVYGDKCLEVAGASTAPGGKVQIDECTGATNQLWSINDNGMITAQNTGLCFDVTNGSTADGALIETYTCNGGGNQSWTRT